MCPYLPPRSRSTSSPHGRKLLPAVPLPDNHKMDWSALVDTATKAVTGIY